MYPDEIRLNPKLPDGSTKLLLRGVHYRGSVLDITIGPSQTDVMVTSTAIDARLLTLRVTESGREYKLNVDEKVTFQNGHVLIKVDEEKALLS